MRLFYFLSIMVAFWVLSGYAYGQCVEPQDGLEISENIVFCEGTYDMPRGMVLVRDNINIVCLGTAFKGDGNGHAFTVFNLSNAIISDCEISGYLVGIYSNHSSRLIITGNYIHDNEFAGIFLENTSNSIIMDNELINNGRSNLYFMSESYRNSVSGNVFENPGFYNIILNDGDVGNDIVDNKIFGQNILDANEPGLNFYCLNEKDNDYLDGAFGPGCDIEYPTPIAEVEDVKAFDAEAQDDMNTRRVNSLRAACINACSDALCDVDCDSMSVGIKAVLDEALSRNETVLDIKSVQETTQADIALFIEAIPLDNPLFRFKDKTEMIKEMRLRYDNSSDLLSVRKTLITVEDMSGKQFTDVVVNVFPSKELANLTIMEFIPKSTAMSADDITVIEIRPYAEMVVLNEDPLVVWSFSEVRDDVTIRYRVDKVVDPPKTLSVAETKKERIIPEEEPVVNVPVAEKTDSLMAYGMLALIPVIVGGVIYFSRFRR